MSYKDPNKKKENNRQWRLKNPDYQKAWRKIHGGYSYPIVSRNSQRLYRKRNRSKCNARAKLYYAIKRGYIVRPLRCERCLFYNEKIEAHHTDYTHPLDVLWVCRPCHLVLEKEKAPTKGPLQLL